MKKIFLGFLLLMPLWSGETVIAKYGLDEAMKSLNDSGIEVTRPKYLPGSTERSGKNLVGDATDITGHLQLFMNAITFLAGALAVGFFIVNAFTLVMATAEADKITKAKKGMVWSLVGLVLIIGAYVVTKTIISLTYSGEAAVEISDGSGESDGSSGAGGSGGGGGGRIPEAELKAREHMEKQKEVEKMRRQYENPSLGDEEERRPPNFDDSFDR